MGAKSPVPVPRELIEAAIGAQYAPGMWWVADELQALIDPDSDEPDPHQPALGTRITREQVNDELTDLAHRIGVDTSAEGVDETLDDLTHTVADAFGVAK